MKLVRIVLLVSVCLGLALAQTQTPTTKSPSASEAVKQGEHQWVDAVKAGDAEKVS